MTETQVARVVVDVDQGKKAEDVREQDFGDNGGSVVTALSAATRIG